VKTTLLTALAPATWGTTYFVTTEFLPPDRPLLTATLRALPAGLLALAAARTLPQGSWWWRSGVLGALNIGVFFGLLFLAAYRLPGGLAAILVASAPLFVVALAWPLLGERPTIVSVSAGTVGLAGVALLVLSAETTLDPVGAAGALGAAVSLALGIVLTSAGGVLPGWSRSRRGSSWPAGSCSCRLRWLLREHRPTSTPMRSGALCTWASSARPSPTCCGFTASACSRRRACHCSAC
jgi:drug/metabolite transporter (DMT)-like permease